MTAVEPEARGGFAGWWDGLGRAQRAALVVVAVVAGVNIALAGLGGVFGRNPGGPVSSSYSTGQDGLQAWSELLARNDHAVTRLRERPSKVDLAADATVVVADPDQVPRADQERLAGFVAGGGRLVVVGPSGAPLLSTVTGTRVLAGYGGRDARTWVPVPENAGVNQLAGGSGAVFSVAPPLVGVSGDRADTTGASPRNPSGAVLLVGEVGEGRVVALADSALLQNAAIARGDNAALALQVVGPAGRPVVFVESVHGFAATGLNALPANWRWAAAGLGLAFAAGLWSAGSRFGAAEPLVRELRPARVEHVQAVAADLDRVAVSFEDVVGPLATSTRAQLAARVGAPPDASPAVLHAAADRAGIDARQIAALTEPVADLDHALAVGALAAARQRAERSIAEPHVAPAAADTVPADPRPGGPPS